MVIHSKPTELGSDKKLDKPSTRSLVIQQCPTLSRIFLLYPLSQRRPSLSVLQGMSCRYCTTDVTCLTLPGRVPQDAIAELKALANIIQSSIEQIEEVTTAKFFTFPSPDLTFSPESEAPRMDPAIQTAGSLIVSAAAQLITLVRPASLTLLDISTQVSLEVPRRYHVLLLTMWEY